MTALVHESAQVTTTCVLVDLGDCGVPGVRWAAACADALGVGLVVHAAAVNDPAHADVAALLAEYPALSVHIEHHNAPPARWEGGLVVLSRPAAVVAPPLAGRDLRDVVVLGGSAAALAGCFGVVTAVVDAAGGDGVLQRATTFCRARQATRLRVLTRPYTGDSLDAVAGLLHGACPSVIVELVREARSVQDETRLFPSDLLVVSGRERGPAEGLQPAAREALQHAHCPVLFSCS